MSKHAVTVNPPNPAKAGAKQLVKLRKRKVFHIVLETDPSHPFDPLFTAATAVQGNGSVPVPNGFEWNDGEIVHFGAINGVDNLRAKIAFCCTKKQRGHVYPGTMSSADPGSGTILITLDNSVGAGATNPTVDPVPVEFIDDTE